MIPIKEPKMPINLLNGKYTFWLFFIIQIYGNNKQRKSIKSYGFTLL